MSKETVEKLYKKRKKHHTHTSHISPSHNSPKREESGVKSHTLANREGEEEEKIEEGEEIAGGDTEGDTEAERRDTQRES